MTWTTILNRQEGERYLAPLIEILTPPTEPRTALVLRLHPAGTAAYRPIPPGILSPERPEDWIPVDDYPGALVGLEAANRRLYLEYLREAARHLARQAHTWDRETLDDLIPILRELDEVCEALEVPPTRYVLLTDLPTAPLPPGSRTPANPIWVADRRGYALVGQDGADIEHISSEKLP